MTGQPLAASPAGRLVALGDRRLCDRLRTLGRPAGLADMIVAEPGSFADPAGDDLALVVTHGYDDDLLRTMARHRATGLTWLPVALTDAGASVGPIEGPGYEATVADLLARRVAAADHPDLVRSSSRAGRDWDDPELAWLAAVVALEVRRHRRGELCRCAEHELVVDPATMTITRHRVIPLPFPLEGKPTMDPEVAGPPVGITVPELIDPRVGVVTRLRRIRHHRSIPRQLVTVHAHVANMRRISPWLTDPVTAGSSFASESEARQAAIGEAVERYAGEIVQPANLRLASWEELTADGELAVDPESLVLFSDRQYATRGFPFVPLTRKLPVQWVRGRYLTANRPAWLPASLVHPNWYTGDYLRDPPTNNPFYPGLAAGPDLDSAIAAGIQEVIERDATMVWWSNAHRLPTVRPSLPLRAVWHGQPRRSGQRAWLVHLDNEFGVPVMAGMVEHTADRLFTMGFAARPDPELAALKAWAEALTLQDGARDLDSPTGGYRRSVARGDVNGQYVKPFRADRRYLDDYREDLRDVVDLMCQLQIHLDPRALERVRPWVDVDADRGIDDLPRLPDGSLDTYRRVVEDRGYGIYYADVTTSDVAATGLRVVRVLVPGLAPNFASAFPFLGRGRLTRAAVELGWRTAPLAEADINLFPLAHA
jgi:ribosomal protein S12 methylthiotransferase accessory factor